MRWWKDEREEKKGGEWKETVQTQGRKGDRIVTVKERGGDILRQSVTQGREVGRGCKLV